MLFQNNFFIHAVAGSGKTTRIVKLALREKKQKILITTYTNKNTEEIRKKIININGYIPQNIEVKTWFSFLLSDCVRPYQRVLGFNNRISEVFFTVQNPHNKKLPDGKIIKTAERKDGARYYVNSKGKIYSCMLSDFAFHCNAKANGAVINRIENCYDYIFIDEAQDFSGWDFSFLDLLLESACKILIVGDKRQNLFDTHKSSKNPKYRDNLHLYFSDKQKKCKGILKEMNNCWRCNDCICCFADKLHPALEPSISLNMEAAEHSGIYYIRESHIGNYLEKYNPQILAWNKNNKIAKKYKTMNLGASKGLTFDRVLIIPTSEIKSYIKNGAFQKDSLVVRNKLYVGITRAKHSVAFLVEDTADLSKYYFSEIAEWQPNIL